MKARTRKLAWLLSAAMVFTSVNPGMTVMASEENEVTEQSMEESTAADEDVAAAEDETSAAEDVEILEEEGSEEDGSIEEITTAEPEEGEEQLLMAEEQQTGETAEAIATYDDKGWSVKSEKEQTITGYEGSAATLEVEVNNPNNADLHYYWYIAYQLEEDERSDEDQIGDDSATLKTVLHDKEIYMCVVTDEKNMSYNETVVFHVSCTNTLQFSKIDRNVIVKMGDALNLTVNATSTIENATINYTWTKDEDETTVGVGTGSTYTKENFTKADAGNYTCKITDGHSMVLQYFYVQLDSGLRIQAPKRVEVEKGETKAVPISVTTDADQKDLSVTIEKFDSEKPGWVEIETTDFSKLQVIGTGEIQRYKINATDGLTDTTYSIAVGPKALLDAASNTEKTAKILTPGVAETAAICGEPRDAYFKFIPNKAGNWRFYSTGTYGTSCYIYEADGEELAESSDIDEYKRNFDETVMLKANEVYYLSVGFAGKWSEAYGTFKVYAELVSESNCQHQWSEATVTKKATCAEEGVSVKRCSVCGEEISSSIPKTAHSFGAYQVTTAPTALAAGVQTRTCSVCGYKETSEIAKLPASVSLSATSVPLQVKQTVSLEKLITSMTTGDRLVSCSSSNKKIATVSKAGKVTGKAAGNAKITMTFASGITKTVTVKVQKKKVATSKITNVPGSITLKVKSTYKLSPVIAPISTKEKATYKTANKKIATVSKSGKITAKKAGKTTITVKVGKKTKKVKVTVKK